MFPLANILSELKLYNKRVTIFIMPRFVWMKDNHEMSAVLFNIHTDMLSHCHSAQTQCYKLNTL